jgi:hypothetical protein
LSTKTDFNGAFAKAETSTNSTFRGIKIDSRFESKNAFDSIRFNDDGDSNEIDESDSHQRKQDDPRISTEHGIKIDSRPESDNASDSIRFSDDGDSNEIDESEAEEENLDPERISTEQGIQTRVIVKSRLCSTDTIRRPPTTLTRRMHLFAFAFPSDHIQPFDEYPHLPPLTITCR